MLCWQGWRWDDYGDDHDCNFSNWLPIILTQKSSSRSFQLFYLVLSQTRGGLARLHVETRRVHWLGKRMSVSWHSLAFVLYINGIEKNETTMPLLPQNYKHWDANFPKDFKFNQRNRGNEREREKRKSSNQFESNAKMQYKMYIEGIGTSTKFPFLLFPSNQL